jgi:hypothetical protein
MEQGGCAGDVQESLRVQVMQQTQGVLERSDSITELAYGGGEIEKSNELESKVFLHEWPD